MWEGIEGNGWCLSDGIFQGTQSTSIWEASGLGCLEEIFGRSANKWDSCPAGLSVPREVWTGACRKVLKGLGDKGQGLRAQDHVSPSGHKTCLAVAHVLPWAREVCTKSVVFPPGAEPHAEASSAGRENPCQ